MKLFLLIPIGAIVALAQPGPFTPLIFTGTNPNGNACSTSSPLLFYTTTGVLYGCQGGVYASLSSGGGGGSGSFGFVPASACDGVSDASSTIQATLNNASYGTVILPAGNCLIGATTITVPDGKALLCTGISTFGATPVCKVTYSGTGIAISATTGNQKVEIAHINLVKSGAADSSVGIQSTGIGSWIHDNNIQGFHQGILEHGSQSPGGYFDHIERNYFSSTTSPTTENTHLGIDSDGNGPGGNVINKIFVTGNVFQYLNIGVNICQFCNSWTVQSNTYEYPEGNNPFGVKQQSTTNSNGHDISFNHIEQNGSARFAGTVHAIDVRGYSYIGNNELPTADSGTWQNLTYNAAMTVNTHYTGTDNVNMASYANVQPYIWPYPLTLASINSRPGCSGNDSGLITTISDASSPSPGAIAVGGGALTVPVWCDGTNWRIFMAASTYAMPNGTTATTQADNSADNKLATNNYVNTRVSNAIAAVNPAVAVQAATAAVLPNSPTYGNGAAGIGATLTTVTLNAALVVDGYTPALNERVLVKNQASALQNGVYTVTQLAAIGLAWILTRALDFDQPSDMNNTGAIPVINGTVNTATQWVISSTVNTVGTDAVTFTQFSIAPSGIVRTPNTCSITAAATTNFDAGTCNSTTGTYTYFVVSMGASITSSALSNLIPGQVYALEYNHDATTNNYSLTLPSGAGNTMYWSPARANFSYTWFCFAKTSTTCQGLGNNFSAALISATSEPAGNCDTGLGCLWYDSTEKRSKSKDDAGAKKGGVADLAALTHQFLTSIVNGSPTRAQPACGDLSDAAASCNTDATNAGNISAGTLALARLGNQNANTFLSGPLGGSAAAPSFKNLGQTPITPASDTLTCSSTANITTQIVYFANSTTIPAFTQVAGAAYDVDFTTLITSSASTVSAYSYAVQIDGATTVYTSNSTNAPNASQTNAAYTTKFRFGLGNTTGASANLYVSPLNTVGGTNRVEGAGQNTTAPLSGTFDSTATHTVKFGIKCTNTTAGNSQQQTQANVTPVY